MPMSIRSLGTVFTSRRFRVERLQVIQGDRRTERDIVRHPGAVTILPVVDRDHICLIRNFRVSVAEELIELPAGTLEPPEPPETTAIRELKEETGYQAKTWRRLGEFYLSPGILDENMHLFLATDLVPGPPRREPGEQIDNWIVTWTEAMDMVRSGAIRDAKTLVALLLYDRQRAAGMRGGPIGS